ncbi:hypothetical protein V1512DRAFT_284948 [Lipomyces arxii]|uniref:uncharacterized protein n=1 Tax=Lipomyces arxii TaxID=56418 RepID=UPI0034CE1234
MNTLTFIAILSFSWAVSALRLIQSSALSTCIDNSDFSASLFNVLFTPDNRTVSIDIVAVSTLNSNITALLTVNAYGLNIVSETLNPCELGLNQLCPMKPGQFDLQTDLTVSSSVISGIPGIAYTVPDLDGTAKVQIYDHNNIEVACVQARLSNGKTVNSKIVSWVTAVLAGIALLVSAVASGLGHSSTAAHIASNGLALFGYFQNIAIIGMCAIKLPPLTSAWAQDFQWTMGIIRVGFMQNIFDWYIKSTGGNPSTLLRNLASVSVLVEKRSLEFVEGLVKRSNNDNDLSTISTSYNLHGIDRVAYLAKIEITSIFVTGLTFFLFFTVIICLTLVLFKFISEGMIRMRWIANSRLMEFRDRWLTIIKGTMYRLVFIGFPQMTLLSLWEFTQQDSPAAIVLAVVMLVMVVGLMAWAAFKVIQLAKRSVAIHKNPAYILYSDPTALNRWGFIYVQFRATAYYFIVPVLIYTFVKACFIAFGQTVPTVQGIVLMLIEFMYLLLVSILKPYMDKRTNIFNIIIQSCNFLNAILFFFFTGVTKVPAIVIGVMGVVFFVLNAAFSLVLLIMIMVSCLFALLSKNPDTRYQPMRDDRASFLKSSHQLPEVMELAALGATARGYVRPDRDDDKYYG